MGVLPMRKLGSFCTGYGGLDLAAQVVFGAELAWWSDIEPAAIATMQHHHPGTPNLGDLKTVDWSKVEPVDVLTAGYPCQPFSNAGKRKGTDDPRHLWPWIADAISQLRPRHVILENVAGHLRRGFDVVSADLAALGYDTAWSVVRASDVGAPHRRERLFVVASDASREHVDWAGEAWPGGRREPSDGGFVAPDAQGVGRGEGRPESAGQLGRPDVADSRTPVTADTDGSGLEGLGRLHTAPGEGETAALAEGGGAVAWQEYGPAIRRWEHVLGVPAPRPDTRGPRGGVKVNPEFAEWLMGVPGRITEVPGLSINARLKMAGNGVVPQQAAHAVRGLLERLTYTGGV